MKKKEGVGKVGTDRGPVCVHECHRLPGNEIRTQLGLPSKVDGLLSPGCCVPLNCYFVLKLSRKLRGSGNGKNAHKGTVSSHCFLSFPSVHYGELFSVHACLCLALLVRPTFKRT